MSTRTKVIATSAVVLALLVAWPVASHHRAKRKVEDYQRQLKARGEKLEIAELTPPHSADDFRTSADLMRAASYMRSSSPSYSNLPPTMKFVAPGKALVSWQQAILPTDQTTNVWPGLSADLADNREAMEEVRSALQGPVLAFDLDYTLGVATPLNHLSRLKGIAQWLSAAAVLDLHGGRTKRGLDQSRRAFESGGEISG